jgi:transposase
MRGFRMLRLILSRDIFPVNELTSEHLAPTIPSMARYKALSEDARQILIYMYHKRNLNCHEIAHNTNLDTRAIQKVVKHFHETGEVMPHKETVQKERKLNADNASVSTVSVSTIIFDQPVWSSTSRHCWNTLLIRTWMNCKTNYKTDAVSMFPYLLSGGPSSDKDLR